MGIEEICGATGHWVWQRDFGARWLLDEAAGPATSLYNLVFAREPEHWFRVREDGTWALRVTSAATQPVGEEEVFDVSGEVREGVARLGGEDVAARVCSYIEGDRLVIEWLGLKEGGGRIHLKNSKEVIKGLYHSTVEDLVRNAKGTRVFRRYPWYKIENWTGETVTLRTYAPNSFLRLAPAMTVELVPGVYHIDASSAQVEQEEAVFSLASGREYRTVIENSQTVHLSARHFSELPYYEIENSTGEDVALETYGAADFMCLFPATAAVLTPGTSHVPASPGGEQAVFTRADGQCLTYPGIKPFEHVALSLRSFG